MKKHWISHPDEEDPGAICALLRAMKLNVWGGEESYSVGLLEQKGQGRGGCESRDVLFVLSIISSFSSILCCWQQGWNEEEEERGGV